MANCHNAAAAKRSGLTQALGAMQADSSKATWNSFKRVRVLWIAAFWLFLLSLFLPPQPVLVTICGLIFGVACLSLLFLNCPQCKKMLCLVPLLGPLPIFAPPLVAKCAHCGASPSKGSGT